MAITPAQRKTAIGLLVTSAFTNSPPLAQLLPGVTSDQVLTAIANAVGATQDANLTTALANQVAELNASIASLQATITQLQAQATADTVV